MCKKSNTPRHFALLISIKDHNDEQKQFIQEAMSDCGFKVMHYLFELYTCATKDKKFTEEELKEKLVEIGAKRYITQKQIN